MSGIQKVGLPGLEPGTSSLSEKRDGFPEFSPAHEYPANGRILKPTLSRVFSRFARVAARLLHQRPRLTLRRLSGSLTCYSFSAFNSSRTILSSRSIVFSLRFMLCWRSSRTASSSRSVTLYPGSRTLPRISLYALLKLARSLYCLEWNSFHKFTRSRQLNPAPIVSNSSRRRSLLLLTC